MNISFIGTGHYLPEIIQPNSQFKESEFIDENGKAFEAENTEIIEKFQAITGNIKPHNLDKNPQCYEYYYFYLKVS